MKKITFITILTAILVCGLTACTKSDSASDTMQISSAAAQEDKEPISDITENEQTTEEETDMKPAAMNITIGDTVFTASLEENTAVNELVDMMTEEPVVLSLSDYAGFEKVGPLGRSLTTDNMQMTTTAGDIVLYNGSQIVMFYGSNSWSYTMLAHVDDLTGWAEALGSGDVTVTFSID